MTSVLDRPSDAAAPLPGAGRVGHVRRPRRANKDPRPPLGRASGVGLGVITLWVTLLVVLPLAVVVAKAFGGGWGEFVDAVTDHEAASALELTIVLALLVAVANGIMGTLVAWVLVRERFRGAGVFEMVIDIPFALPTIVAGLVMITLYGGNSPVGIHLVATRVGIFVALLFVTLPFTVRTVQPVLRELDRDVEQAAASLGASPVVVFRRIVLPQILPAAGSGIGLAFARALGEFGSLVLISGGIPGHTLIAPAYIYGKLQDATSATTSTQEAAAVATVLLAASAVVLVLIDLVQRRMARRG